MKPFKIPSIGTQLINCQVYGGKIIFPEDKSVMRKFLKINGWHKPKKYSRQWVKSQFKGQYELHMAYNLELFPDRVTKIRANWPLSAFPELKTLLPAYKEGISINVPLDNRKKYYEDI